MEEILYQMIFKRKSFHIFKDIVEISLSVLAQIEEMFKTCKPLVPDIRVGMKNVPAEKTTCKRGEEYCILLYSEQMPGSGTIERTIYEKVFIFKDFIGIFQCIMLQKVHRFTIDKRGMKWYSFIQ